MNVESRRRLVIPAQRFENRETFLFGRPWFVRPAASPPETSGPSLLTFTTDEFIDAFFASLGKADGGATTDAFERLLPWRDYAEPPAAMIDVSGARLYPASIARIALAADEVEPIGAAIPDEGPHPWLRKLYLPSHEHYHLCTAELACRSHGYPKVAAKRVVEAGAIIRRLVRNAGAEIREDWIEGPRGEGAWIRIADPAMRRLNDTSRLLDPADVEAAVPSADLGGLHARLKIDVTAGDRLGLSVARLARVPKSKPGGDIHTVVYGYLPIHSSALVADDRVDANALADAGVKLRARADSELRAAFFGSPMAPDPQAHFVAMRRRMREALSALLAATVLASPPDVVDPRPAIVDTVVGIDRLTGYLLDAMRLEAGSLQNVATWWQTVIARAAQAADRLLASNPVPLVTITYRFDRPAGRAALARRLSLRLSAILRGVLPSDLNADGSTANRAEIERVIAVALLRLRAFRGDLLVGATAPTPAGPADTAATVENRETSSPSQVPALTVELAAAELAVWIELNTTAWRDINPLPWPQVPLPAHEVSAHAAGAALEALLGDWDEKAANAGSVYADHRDALISAAIPDVDLAVIRRFTAAGGPDAIVLPTDRARAVGLSMLEQSAYGLFAFPGMFATAASFDTALGAIADRFLAASQEAAKAELKARHEAVRPRLDSDHLYAVWAYARIAGRTPCENARIVWTGRSDVFQIAEPMDMLGVQPVSIRLPDLKKLLRDLPRIPKARARPNASVVTPPDSGVSVGPLMSDTSPQLGFQLVCTYGIPVFTICAWILFQVIYNILKNIPGFTWMPLLKRCRPGGS